MKESAEFGEAYFERNYRDYARHNPPRKMRFYRALAERHAPSGRAVRVLDVGCAFGTFLSSLDPAWERFGCDVSEFAIDRARRLVPGVAFEVGSATRLPFDGSFDLITAFDVIEHVPSLDAVRSALRSRLAPEGRFLFVVPVYDGPAGPLVRLLDGDTTHVHKRSRRFWLDWTGEHFELVEWLGVFRYLLPGGYYAHLPTRRLRGIAPAIVVAAKPRSGP